MSRAAHHDKAHSADGDPKGWANDILKHFFARKDTTINKEHILCCLSQSRQVSVYFMLLAMALIETFLK